MYLAPTIIAWRTRWGRPEELCVRHHKVSAAGSYRGLNLSKEEHAAMCCITPWGSRTDRGAGGGKRPQDAVERTLSLHCGQTTLGASLSQPGDAEADLTTNSSTESMQPWMEGRKGEVTTTNERQNTREMLFIRWHNALDERGHRKR